MVGFLWGFFLFVCLFLILSCFPHLFKSTAFYSRSQVVSTDCSLVKNEQDLLIVRALQILDFLLLEGASWCVARLFPSLSCFCLISSICCKYARHMCLFPLCIMEENVYTECAAIVNFYASVIFPLLGWDISYIRLQYTAISLCADGCL